MIGCAELPKTSTRELSARVCRGALRGSYGLLAVLPSAHVPAPRTPAKELQEAERDLDAATKPSEIRAAAQKRRLAVQGLQWLDEQERAERSAREGERKR
jgi:hypothetical protein